jgi:hypothetical protein
LGRTTSAVQAKVEQLGQQGKPVEHPWTEWISHFRGRRQRVHMGLRVPPLPLIRGPKTASMLAARWMPRDPTQSK